MKQIRVSIPNFASGVNFDDPIILEQADDITLSRSVNSSDQSISFTLPLSDPKLQYVTYLRWWECWETTTNERLNFGPIESITRTSAEKKTITGPGRPALLAEYHKSIQTFYYPIDVFFDDLRFENLAAAPRTSTLINKQEENEYYGLSLRTKDSVIDEQTGYIAIGRDSPYQGTIKTNNYWAGTGKADYITVDLGDDYTISRGRVMFPWWGGVTIQNNRSFDWNLLYSSNDSSYANAFSTPNPNYHVPHPEKEGLGQTIYFGESGFEADQVTASGNNITGRYFKFDIDNAHAWYGNAFSGLDPTDEWNWECGGTDVYNGSAKQSPTDGVIPKKDIAPDNDCYASMIEVELDRKILSRDTITSKSYRQIENSSRQLTFFHVPTAGEMITTGTATKRKFEPGTTFRKVKLTWSGAALTIKDEFNTVLYVGATSGTNVSVNLPAYTRMIQLEGPTNTQVTECDAWRGILDAFSYGGSYSFSTVTNDYFILHFRGTSLKWFATVPNGSTAGQVSIELRSHNGNGTWSGWSTLEASLTLPTNIAGEKVWEITEESGTLSDDTIYELRVTNLNGGYVSVDAFTGYWSANYIDFNEDDPRFRFRNPTTIVQEYDSTYFGGSVYKFTQALGPAQSIQFVGDRIIIISKKGPSYGTFKVGITRFDANVGYGQGNAVVYIPGGNVDGTVTVDLNSTTTIPQAVVFDSADYWTATGMPWDSYLVGVYTQGDLPVYIDAMGVHERSGISVKFVETTYLDILKATCEVLRLEWDILESGLKIVPRIGEDTYEVLKEGTNTTIRINEVQDVSQVATELIITGADIDGLPLTARVEDKVSREIIGRSIQRQYDLRSVGSYFTLIAAGRVELRRRRYPQKRISISHKGPLPVSYGDSFIVKHKEAEYRVRANTIRELQSSSSGASYELECTEWPPIP